MTIEATRLNDVDIETVGGLIGAVQAEPHKANTTWAATVEWKGGFASEARIRDFAPVPSDEPAGLGGSDTAPNPVEQLLGALGNCLAVGYAANATASGIEITDLRIDLEGELDLHTFLGLRNGHAGYDAIRVKVHLESAADQAEIDELHEKVIGTSPVGHTLQRPVPVSIQLA
jgi:uncharacterized OsmC-like protein